VPRITTLDFTDNYTDLADEEEERRARRLERHKLKVVPAPAFDGLADLGSGATNGFNPSYMGSRHERQWILTYLGGFYDDHLITDVLRQVKGGKEATVYACRAHPSTGYDLLAAKVYRPRMFRNLRNDAQYREGRSVLGDDGKAIRGRREWLAMHKGTRFGQELRHESWLAHEFGTLEFLQGVGADVPKPISLSENAMLMEYFGGETGAAPTLNTVDLDLEQARPLFNRLMGNVELMLSHERIHGDLSAYNVLYWEGRVTIIDFPQVVNALANPNAPAIFTRDVERLCRYFAPYGITVDPVRLAQALWVKYYPDKPFSPVERR